jgi:large subunit ribosomal protein L22
MMGCIRLGVPSLPEFKFSFAGFDPLLHVRASNREVDVSPKAASEVCSAIRGMRLAEAKKFLEDVIALKRSVAFRRYKKKAAHRSDLFKFHAGGYPVKAAEKVLQVLQNLEANSDFKGRDTDRLTIIHAAALRGRVIKGHTPRAMGRSSPSFNTLVHIEVVAKEV